MLRISNSDLNDAIKVVSQSVEYIKFISLCKNRLLKLRDSREISYIIKDNGTSTSMRFIFDEESDYYKYLDYLHSNIEDIVKCDLHSFNLHKEVFDEFEFEGLEELEILKFKEKVLNTLHYGKFRSESGILFSFYKELGVKVCVYCNTQHVVLLRKQKKARLQADHHLPKTKYPHFAISFINLYPSCNNCNHLKGEDLVYYDLYYDNSVEDAKNHFKFEVSEKEIIDCFLTSIDENNFSIDFDQGNTKLNDVLHIDQIYENHKDYVVDLMHTYKCYGDKYLESLTNDFSNLFNAEFDNDQVNNQDLFNRMIYGVSLNDEHINKRVFSKMIGDVKSQLDTLKKEGKISNNN